MKKIEQDQNDNEILPEIIRYGMWNIVRCLWITGGGGDEGPD